MYFNFAQPLHYTQPEPFSKKHITDMIKPYFFIYKLEKKST